MRLRGTLLAAVPVALAIAGCGGGGGGENTAPPVSTQEEPQALSKAELIKQGDSICAEVNAAVGTVDASEARTSSQISQAADLYGGMVERLKSLGTPEEDSAGYAEFTNAADELSQAESDAQLASERGDESGLAEAQSKVEEKLEAFEEAAAAFGFEECSEAPRAPSVSSGTSGGVEEEAAPETEAAPEEVAPEEAAPEEAAPETGGAGGTEGGGTGAGGGGGATGGGSGGIGPG
jgi:hypothetical protein